ncbi:MAG: hypothetical protein AAB075_05135 [Gemmatimonadota bacterium]
MTALDGWLAARTEGAPKALCRRVQHYLHPTEAPDAVDTLVGAARSALAAASGAEAGRSVAIDLLTADALITLALLRQSETEPGALAARARAIRLDSSLRG